jgi:ligand-binding sensor domain-containing protein
MIQRILILLFLGILLMGVARAQTGAWTTYLSPTQVNDYAEKDNKAYFATDAGIYVMDKTTRAIEHWTKNTTGLPSDRVESIAFHPDTKTMFIGTYDIALAYYDDGEWHSLTYPEDIIPQWGNPTLTYCVAFDAEGRLWAGTNRGLIRYQDGQWAIYNQQNTGLFIDNVWKLENDLEGRILVGSHVMARVAGDQIEQLSPESDGANNQFIFSYSDANMICQQNGDLWFFTDIGIVCHYNGQSWDIQSQFDNIELPFGQIQYVTEDQQGQLWANIGQNGFIRYDGSAWVEASPLDAADAEAVSSGLVYTDWATLLFHQNKVLVHTPEATDDYTLGNYPYDPVANQLTRDHEGQIWGMLGYHTLRNLTTGETIEFELNGAPLYLSTPTFDPQGRLWAMGGERVCYYENGEWHIFDPSNSPLPADEYYTDMIIDPQGDVWVFIYDWGLCRYNGQEWKVVPHPTVANGYVVAMGPRQAGEIWLGIWVTNIGTRMYRFNGETLSLQNTGFNLSYAGVISQDPSSGRVYVAGTTTHIEYWDNGVWAELALPAGLPTDEYIYQLIADNGRLVAASQHHLMIFENGEWTVFTSLNAPISSENISDIELDHLGQLWVIHNNTPVLEIYQAGLVNSIPEPGNQPSGLLQLAPNPAVNSVTLHYDMTNTSALCTIYNLQGQEVRRVLLDTTAGNHPTVDLSGLHSGIYLVSLSTGGRNASARLVVQGTN